MYMYMMYLHSLYVPKQYCILIVYVYMVYIGLFF